MRGTVVVSEDDAGLREVLLHVLHDAGYQVHLVAGEGDTLIAVRRLARGCLLVMDAKLPGGASETILRTLGSEAALQGCPVLLLSDTPVESKSPNVVGILRKPFELTRMLSLVRSFCPAPALPPSPVRGSTPAAA